MAIFRCAVKPNLTRSKGQCSVFSAAYIARERLTDERTGETRDFTRAGTLLFSGIFTPKNAPEWAHDRQQLWNEVEKAEKRKDSQLARPIELALPHEMTDEQRRWLVQDYVKDFTRQGYVVDVAIHAPDKDGDKRNYHAHLLIPLRLMEADGFAKDKKQEQEIYRNQTAYVEKVRERWAHHTNRHLERHGYEARVDHRSLEAQGIDREPTKHLGPTATELEREGQETERGNENRAIKKRNEERDELKRQANELEKERRNIEGKARSRAAFEKRREEIRAAQEMRKTANFLKRQDEFKAELLKRQEAEREELTRKMAARGDKLRAWYKDKAQQITDDWRARQKAASEVLEKRMEERKLGFVQRASLRLKLEEVQGKERKAAERHKEALEKSLIRTERRRDTENIRRARDQQERHAIQRANLEIRQAEIREKYGIKAPERDETAREAKQEKERLEFARAARETGGDILRSVRDQGQKREMRGQRESVAKTAEKVIDRTIDAMDGVLDFFLGSTPKPRHQYGPKHEAPTVEKTLDRTIDAVDGFLDFFLGSTPKAAPTKEPPRRYKTVAERQAESRARSIVEAERRRSLTPEQRREEDRQRAEREREQRDR